MLMQKLIEFLAPAACVGCEREGSVLCLDCRTTGIRPARPACFRCEAANAGGETCARCRAHSSLSGVIVGARFQDSAQRLIHTLKFQRSRAAAVAGAELILAQWPAGFTVDSITAVPISPARRRERGYNQSELVAKELAKRLGLPYGRLLARSSSMHQIGQDRAGRLAAVEGMFWCIGSTRGQRLLIVDDVLTTGATLDECAHVLRTAGATSVHGAVIARQSRA